MDKQLEHFGIQGMHWGQRKKYALVNVTKKSSDAPDTAKVKSFISIHGSKKAGDFVKETNSKSFGEKLANAYGIKLKSNGKIKSIGVDTFPKIYASAVVAYLSASAVSDVGRLVRAHYMNGGKIPKWVGDIAWTTGKIISNTPIR